MKDPYLYPDTNTLINYFDIKDLGKLNGLEKQMFKNKSLLPLPKGNFDLPHLKSIHKHFFGEIYPWAGEIRTIDEEKNRQKKDSKLIKWVVSSIIDGAVLNTVIAGTFLM